MQVLYLTQKGIIEYFEGTNFASVEPVFVLWFSQDDDLILWNQMNEYERIYNGLDGWKFEIQPHMFSLKGKPSITPAPIDVDFERPHVNVPHRDEVTVNLVWNSPAVDVYFVSENNITCSISSGDDKGVVLFGDNPGTTIINLYSVETDKLLASLEVTVI